MHFPLLLVLLPLVAARAARVPPREMPSADHPHRARALAAGALEPRCTDPGVTTLCVRCACLCPPPYDRAPPDKQCYNENGCRGAGCCGDGSCCAIRWVC